jgi:endonuclease/exonuclease/phosphatase family metal-dependent hydrolase
MRVLTWNIARKDAYVLHHLQGLDLDVLTLQEVPKALAPAFVAACKSLGLAEVNLAAGLGHGKIYGNLIASQWPFDASATRSFDGAPFPELLAHERVLPPDRDEFDVFTVHAPNGSGNGWDKIRTLEVLRDVLQRPTDAPRIVTGDFNEPLYLPGELPVKSFAWKADEDGELRLRKTWTRTTAAKEEITRPGREWDDAVTWFFDDSAGHGLRHAYWDKHGRGAMEPSHHARKKPRWFDHIFVSERFKVMRCEFPDALRCHPDGTGPSDHSALLAELQLASA